MTRLEMVEKLREKAGVTYDVARDALENNNWDMLDAVIALERENEKKSTAQEQLSGKVIPPETVTDKEKRTKDLASGVSEKINTGLRFVLKLIGKGENLRVEILYRDRLIGSVSVTVLVLMLLFCWYVPVLLAIVGLIAGYRFRFSNKTVAGKVMNNLSVKLKEDAEKELETVSSRQSEE